MCFPVDYSLVTSYIREHSLNFLLDVPQVQLMDTKNQGTNPKKKKKYQNKLVIDHKIMDILYRGLVRLRRTLTNV